jgi:protease I
MEIAGKRVAIFVEDMYQEHEFWYPFWRMKEAGAKVTVVGTGAKEYHSKVGLAAPGGVAAETVSAGDFDAVIVPGGCSSWCATASTRARSWPPSATPAGSWFRQGS